VHSPSHEETKILAQSAVRSLELRGRVTTCVLGSVIGRAQALVAAIILIVLGELAEFEREALLNGGAASVLKSGGPRERPVPVTQVPSPAKQSGSAPARERTQARNCDSGMTPKIYFASEYAGIGDRLPFHCRRTSIRRRLTTRDGGRREAPAQAVEAPSL